MYIEGRTKQKKGGEKMESYKGIKLPVDDLDLFDELEKMVDLMEGWVANEDDGYDDIID